MNFINEHISESDVKKYDLESIDRGYSSHVRQWTVDKKRNIYLRRVFTGRDDMPALSIWTLFVDGSLIKVEIELLETFLEASGHGGSRMRATLLSILPDVGLSQEEVVEILREALLAYRDGGVFSISKEYSLTLEV